MKKLILGVEPTSGQLEDKVKWSIEQLRTIEDASHEDRIDVFDSYESNVPPTPATAVRTLNVSAPSLVNLAAVVATIIEDIKSGGVNRTQPT